jgi:DNA primase
MVEAYHTSDRNPSPDHPERRGVSRQKVIVEAKAKVSVLDLADRLGAEQGGRWRKVGAEWVRNCVLNDHEDRTPSFAVNPQKNVCFCHGCRRGGDVITLAQLAWDIDRADVAAAQILLTFGHELPHRPPSWFRKQQCQRPVRDAIDRVRFEHLRRRLFRAFCAPSLLRISDIEEREAEAAILWKATEHIARLLVAQLGGGGE